ncbi:hypothetical protein AtEden1_Chr3g0206111 [Arabidopsis thaliana]
MLLWSNIKSLLSLVSLSKLEPFLVQQLVHAVKYHLNTVSSTSHKKRFFWYVWILLIYTLRQ